MDIFVSTVNQTAFLFGLIVIGYILAKLHVLPDNATVVLSKLENTVFIPALVMGTFIENFTVKSISETGGLFVISFIIAFAMIPVGIIISKLMTKDRYIRNIYTYGLVFANFGFMGNAVVGGLFPDIFLEYLIFTLPLYILIYTWAVPYLLLADSESKQTFKNSIKALVNPMFVCMLIGAVIGISGIKVPEWAMSVIDSSGSCMSPVAMILTGLTVSTISLKKTFTNLKIYILSFIRLLVIPLAFVLILSLFELDRTTYICILCSVAMPLGLNTIVIPGAEGKDTTVAAGLALVSHLLSCITIPLVFIFI